MFFFFQIFNIFYGVLLFIKYLLMYRTVLYCVNWAQYRLDFSVFGIAHCQCLLTIILYKVSTVGGGALVPAAPRGGLAPIPPEPKGAPRVAQIMRWAWKKLVCLKSHTPKSPKTFLTVYCMLNMIGVLQVWGRRKRKKWRHFHRPPSNNILYFTTLGARDNPRVQL